jgi:hypothetical protein
VPCGVATLRRIVEGADETPESRLLREHPGLREYVEALPAFIQWREVLPKVDVDAEEFAVVGGDRLMDSDQLIVEWVRLFRPGLLRDA